MIDARIVELLSNYGNIDIFWMDDWGWHIAYADIPFEGRYDLIKSLQPNCLVIPNDHIHPASYGDIEEYEAASTPAISNTRYSEHYRTIRTDSVWAYDPTKDQSSGSLMTKPDILTEILNVNGRYGTSMLAVTPDRTGHLPAAQKTLLESLTT